MRRLVLPPNWPFWRPSKANKHLLLMPLITFITCLLFVTILSIVPSICPSFPSSTRAEMGEVELEVEVMRRGEEMLRTRFLATRSSNKTRTTFPLQVSKQQDALDQAKSSNSEAFTKGNYRSSLVVFANYRFW